MARNLRHTLRKKLCFYTCFGLLAAGTYGGYYIERKIPDKIHMAADESTEFFLGLPLQSTLVSESEEVALGNGSNIPSGAIKLSGKESVTLYSNTLGNYRLGLSLFGIPVKDIEVEVVEHQKAIPCGLPIGIYLKSNGIMVIGTGEIPSKNGELAEPALGILKSGDYIESVNGVPVSTQKELFAVLEQNGSEQAELAIRREDKAMLVHLDPVEAEDGSYKLGIWVREDTQGIGTVTYVDLNGNFGALGHGISDSDTGELVQIVNGTLYDTEIMGIEKGEAGNPGVMSGVIYYGNQSKEGEILENTASGIFGTVNETFLSDLKQEPVELAFKQEVEKGPATILSAVSGEVKEYDIEILKVDSNSPNSNKGMVLRVTDAELLELTGGIIQGMSGSPILQNGKLIGAVTHVFVQDSTKGYGIFIENMLSH
ncbi:MAG: SpoIVB peptidase [bacterium]|nr:SpoIVB peptidase [bacterium]